MSGDRLLYRVREVAEAVGLSERKVNDFIKRGELHSIKIDGSRRVPDDSLKRWIAERSAAGDRQ
jgi:excisionase family DNA binding protein